MKINQNGFGLTGILIVIIVLGSVAATSTYVWSTNNRKPDSKISTSTPLAQEQDKEKTQVQSESYVHPTAGYSFSYPGDWEVETHEGTARVWVGSPDYDDSEDISGHGGNSRGGAFVIDKHPITPDSLKIEDILQDKNGILIDANKITVSGKEAVRFKRTYPSVNITTYVFVDSHYFQLTYSGPNSADYNKYLPDYENLINTFAID